LQVTANPEGQAAMTIFDEIQASITRLAQDAGSSGGPSS
jgi:hypothetical protein